MRTVTLAIDMSVCVSPAVGLRAALPSGPAPLMLGARLHLRNYVAVSPRASSTCSGRIALPIGCVILPESDEGEDVMLLAPYSRFFLRHQLRFRTPYDHGVPMSFIDAKYLDVREILEEAIKKNKASLVQQ